MADFTYASSNNQKYWKDELSYSQKGLTVLDQLEQRNEDFARRAQEKLASLPADSPDRGKYENVLRWAEESRVDIAKDRAQLRETIDDASKNLDDQNTEKQTAASDSESAVESRSSQPLSAKEQENLSRTADDNEQTDDARVTERNSAVDDAQTSGRTEQNVSSNSNSSGPSENLLDRYKNYTYGISLHYMTIEKYNSVMVDGADYTTADNTVLIASGGRRTAELSRNPVFNRDMYFEDFKMNCVIGHNSKSRGSNAIDINFTVVEPMGMTLLDKILEVADQANIRQWDQMPFVIQIDFFANDADGGLVTPIPGATKRICVKIIDIQIKIQPKGATYRVTAIPQTHVGFLQTNSATPANFEVMAKKVKDFFAADGDVGQFGSAVEGAGREESTQSSQKNSFKVYSYAAALNSYQEQLKKLKHQETADVYKFEFDDEMADAEIFVPEKIPMTRTAVQNDNNENQKLDREKGMMPINAGTYIKEVINLILRASEYYRNQIEDRASSNEMESQNSQYFSSLTNQTIKSHKITTKIKYGAWDNIRKMYQKTITFKVEKYVYYNTKYPEAARGMPGPDQINKIYYYMYTGKNQQILDFDIDFNTMFFTVLTAMEKKYAKSNSGVKQEDANKPDPNSSTGEQQIQAARSLHVINLGKDVTQTTSMDKKYVEATDLFKSMMSNSRGDMINVKLKISGDPELIKQDDLFSNLNNSIPTDSGELFCRLEFKLPEDIDQNTGLYIIDNRSIFSGVYKIITVENTFERGQFTQVLDLIRIFDQPDDKRVGSNRTTGSSNNRETGLENNLTTKNSSEYARSNALKESVAAGTLTYNNFQASTGAGEFGEELNYGNFQASTGAGEFGEIAAPLAGGSLRNLRKLSPTLADQTDFGT